MKIDSKKLNKAKLARALLSLTAVAVALILAISVGLNRTFGWFANNTDVSANGMSVVPDDKIYEIITLSDDANNKNGAYYNPHTAILNDESEKCEVWLVDSNSNIGNYSALGTANSAPGLEPGSSGHIKFYVKPYKDVTLRLVFQTIGYASRNTVTAGQPTVEMTELPSSAGDPACYLNGHVLFFRNQNSSGTPLYYTDFLPAEENGERVITRSFEFGSSYDSDTDGDGINDAYEIELYWIWPETLDNLVYNPIAPAIMICDKDEAVQEGEINDYDKVIKNICDYPEYYLREHLTIPTYTEDLLVGRNVQYNDADQEIGMNIDYMMLRLTAELITD